MISYTNFLCYYYKSYKDSIFYVRLVAIFLLTLVYPKASFSEDGWFKTGDYGRLDEDGEFYITGRKKFLIILPNGENIFPETVESHIMESLLYAHEVVLLNRRLKLQAEKMLLWLWLSMLKRASIRI